jgi:ribonuclease BN (tRNA processing enzyme)
LRTLCREESAPQPHGNYIKFLGTAGARFVMVKQLRSSAGTYLELNGVRVLFDPGPGTLVRMNASKPALDAAKLDAIILTHAHIDHPTDINVMIEAMTDGGYHPRGVVFALEECLEGADRVVLKYLRGFARKIEVLRPHSDDQIGDLKFRTSGPHQH